jgi:hypothetical protein
MNPIATVIVSLVNALAALLPQLPAFINSIRASSELSEDGRALLDAAEVTLLARKKRAEEIAANPLPIPDPKPTAR